MRQMSIFAKLFIATLLIFNSFFTTAQTILNYTTDTSGALFSVAAFASGTSLTRVNTAAEPSAICTAGGFSTTHFPAATTYSDTDAAVQVSVTPNTGYTLNVTGFSADLRRSPTGPISVRYAYSTDGGTTWINQGTDQAPNNGSCGALATGLAWGTTFTVASPNTLLFRLFGFNATGISGTLQIENLIINGSVLLTTGCTMPSGLYTSGITTTSTTVNWTAIPGAILYNIQYRPIGSGTWLTDTSSFTSANLTGLTCGTPYEYQVQTVCTGGGTSVFTASSTFTTSSCTCPIPTGLASSAITATGASLSWTAATGALSYNIQYRQTGTAIWSSTTATSTTVNVTGLACGTTYEFQVQTVCSGTSSSVFSASTTFTTLSCACPTPTGLASSAITTTSATVSWSPVVGALTYYLQYRQSGTTTWTLDTVTTTSKNLIGLTCGSTYQFEVMSYCSISSSSVYSSIDSFATTSCSCPTPTGLSATATTTTTGTVTWATTVFAAYYNIQYRKLGTTTWSLDSTTGSTKTITGLTCGTTYQFEVQTVCGGLGTGSYSSIATFTTNSCTTSGSSGNIAIYFNQPVDNTVSTGVNATYLNSAFADTIVAYINRAKYSIDIAQYDYNQSSGYANIATAVNNAYLAGKKVRWIYDGSQSNTGILLLNSGINTVASPTTSAYGIMHDKFVIIDANSTNPYDAIVNTGSEDWGITQFNSCTNNMVFIQDSALAHVYKMEFDMMWGDTGVVPNPSVAKFGPFKTDLGRHTFNIGGKTVELYFSPSDGTDTHIQSSINSANTDLYFGVYTFTGVTDANDIVARQTAGVYTAGIVDQYSNTSSAYPILTAGLGSNLKTYVGAGAVVYHDKMLIVDPSNFCSDPLVLTGSHNWTTAANTQNDENTIIIHNDTVANIYYQSFKANFAALGGSLSTIVNCSTLHATSPAIELMEDGNSFTIYPNPVENNTNLSYHLSNDAQVSLSIYNLVGQQVTQILNNELQKAGEYNFTTTIKTPGVYFVKFSIWQMVFTRKIVKL